MGYKVDKICLRVGSHIQTIVGTFVNGTLEGSAKITFNDNFNVTDTSVYFDLSKAKNPLMQSKTKILNFRNGIQYGLSRNWDRQGNLNQIGYQNFQLMSHTWSKIGNYLVYSNEAFLRNDSTDSEFDFTMNMKNGSSYIGKYHRHLGVFITEYQVKLTEKFDNESCLPKPEYDNEKKVGLIINLKYDLIYSKNIKPECFTNDAKIGDTLEIWKNSLIDSSFGYLTFLRHLINYNRTKSDPKGVKLPFINELKSVDLVRGYFKVSTFNGKPILYNLRYGAVTEDGKLHGLCFLETNPTNFQRIGEHPLLKWAPIDIRGYFINGVLEGPAIIGTSQSNLVYVNFVNGVIHGPVYSFGASLIYHDDYEVYTI